MPNYVYIDLEVEGKRADLKKFLRKHCKNNKFDFDTIIPEPRTKRSCPINCIANEDSHIVSDSKRPWFNWYDWHIRYWGTKWGACDSEVTDNKSSLYIHFSTAWSEPRPIFVALVEAYPNLNFNYFWIEEQGVVDVGRIVTENGKCVLRDVPESGSKHAYELMFESWGNESEFILDLKQDNYVCITDELQEEYDEFVEDWKDACDRTGQKPPCISEWYNNERQDSVHA